MLPGKKYTLEDIGRICLDRWWLILLPLAFGTVAGVLGFAWLPPKYQSETLIMVIPQRIPDSYVKSTVTTNVEDRLRSISEQILSRSRLERIIQDLDLYKDRRRAGLMEDVVQQMRSDIEVKLEGQESSFRVTYSSADPKTALKVTERLAALYIDENLRDREKLADNTSSFLESQLQDAKRRLLEQEKKLEDYRHRYAGQLPSQLEGNLQSLQSVQMQMQSLGESMNRARERRLLVERQLADAQTLPVDVALPGIRMASPADPAALGTVEQLEAARSRLEAARLRYTPDHPDVLQLEQTIQDLETKARDEQRRDKSVSPGEMARQKRFKDLQAELEVIDHQLAAAQMEQSRLQTTIENYRVKIDAVPTRESELVELTRDYGTLQTTYSSLLAKREDSKLAANLERRQIGEQFRILDPASLPERPHNQKLRVGILLGGALGGLGLGLLLVGLLEYRDSSFNCEDDVLRTLSLPVLALVPIVDSDSEGPARRRVKWPPVAGRSAVLLIIGLAPALVASTLQS